MTILNFFTFRKNNTAHIAKKRLKIIISEQKKINQISDYFPGLKNEIYQVVYKHTKIKPKMIQIKINSKNRNLSILELNIFFSK
ncbi:cell division topological specificity factor MinE [Buchnera aphidicola (Mindarus keteleerifoliae)]|uniref:cell division topological specificity factor MinE n=1 Tax=Buchnera aphidicola TaxID=9 RepID=UPI0031B69006